MPITKIKSEECVDSYPTLGLIAVLGNHLVKKEKRGKIVFLVQENHARFIACKLIC